MTDAAALQAVTHRVHRAVLTMAALPSDGPRGFFSSWPAYRHSWWDAGNEASQLCGRDISRRLIRAPVFSPTPAEVDDALPALALLDGIETLNRRIVAARAFQQWYALHGGWRSLCDHFGLSREKLRKLHAASMLYALNRGCK